MKKSYTAIYFAISLVFLLIFSWSTTPLNECYGWDSPFFQTIGLGILQGKVPYVDLFDHKGPLPFFMDALGYSFGLGRLGIFILQVLNLGLVFCILHRIALRLAGSASRAFAAVCLCLPALAVFITEGNQVEEWELPYVSLCLLFALDYLQSERSIFPLWKSLAFGACFALVFLTRPNDGVMWIGGLYFGLFLIWIVRRRYSLIVPNVLMFILGAAVASAPFLGYFAAHDALDDMFYGMIIHNIKYAGDVMFSWGGIGMIIIPALIVVTTLLLARKDERLKDLSFMLVPMLVFTVILIGKRDYYHYLIPLIPYMLLCYTLCLMHSQKVFLWVVCSLLVAFSYRECSFVVNTWLRSSVTREFYAQTDELFRQVPEDERNTVWNYNLDTYKGDRKPHVISQMGAFLHAGLTPSCPVLAAYDIHTMDESYSLQARRPKWLVMTEASYYMEGVEFIYENYELVAQTPQEPVCSVRLYRLK